MDKENEYTKYILNNPNSYVARNKYALFYMELNVIQKLMTY